MGIWTATGDVGHIGGDGGGGVVVDVLAEPDLEGA